MTENKALLPSNYLSIRSRSCSQPHTRPNRRPFFGKGEERSIGPSILHRLRIIPSSLRGVVAEAVETAIVIIDEISYAERINVS